jgi:hypothetical protein
VIDAYRTTWRAVQGTEPTPVAVAASILPGTTAELRATYAAYDHDRRTQGMGRLRSPGRPRTCRPSRPPPRKAISPVFHGTPNEVTEAVLADPGLTAADEIVLFLPPAFGPAADVRLITDLATTVAPALGWSPG